MLPLTPSTIVRPVRLYIRLAPVHLEDNAQPLQGEVHIDGVYRVRLGGNQLGVAAGADDPGVFTQPLLEAGDYPLHQPDVPEHDARLHGADGVAADRRARTAELHPVESGRPLEQRLAADAEAGGDGAAQVVAVLADGVEDGGRPQIDDDEGRPVLLDRGHGVGHAVGPNLAGTIVEDPQAGAHAGADDERLHLEVALADAFEHGLQVGHHAAYDGAVHAVRGDAAVGEEVGHEDPVLVAGLAHVGGKAPGGAQGVAFEDPHRHVGVVDVHRQEHCSAGTSIYSVAIISGRPAAAPGAGFGPDVDSEERGNISPLACHNTLDPLA